MALGEKSEPLSVMPVNILDFDKSPCNLLMAQLIILPYFIKTH